MVLFSSIFMECKISRAKDQTFERTISEEIKAGYNLNIYIRNSIILLYESPNHVLYLSI